MRLPRALQQSEDVPPDYAKPPSTRGSLTEEEGAGTRIPAERGLDICQVRKLRNGYSNISGRSCPLNSMILSAGMFKRLAASRIASALGASYRQ